MNHKHLYHQLPSIDSLLKNPDIIELQVKLGSQLIVGSLRHLQQQARIEISEQGQLPSWHHHWAEALRQYLEQRLRPGLNAIFNLTGTVLHTNFGRAILAEDAITAATKVMRSAVTLEYDLASAGRGHRDNSISELLTELTGAEAACIVNNNAAAVLLILATVAPKKGVIVSRGELVEIGGAFRIPDVMQQAGCRLHEVGTTNCTHLSDYRQSISEDTGLLMKIHTSNYCIQGFTKSVAEQELVKLGKEFKIPVAADLGSGSLIDLQLHGLPAEPMPQTLLAAGVDLVSFSGDKLLGGPQAGIIVGSRYWIDKIQHHPLKRALRAGKLTLAALEATLRLYQRPEELSQQLPTLRLLTRTKEEIQAQAQRILSKLPPHYSELFMIQVEPCLSQIGSGSLPIDRLPSYAITFSPIDHKGGTVEALAKRWRLQPTPIIGRIQEAKFWLDLRCLEDEAGLLDALTQ